MHIRPPFLGCIADDGNNDEVNPSCLINRTTVCHHPDNPTPTDRLPHLCPPSHPHTNNHHLQRVVVPSPLLHDAAATLNSST
jgi:hypothetical protein